ncbi:PQQ-dependent sugar dehydrogenase [Mucilaginibacter sp. CSA2-8R]|uniref:PQQ-dependent sugar dehydrogenase n=1 Tax=Mucilaginibacter sp. CSA2-8R TaxID=3141542 RepID=UPI00315C8782
MHEKFSARIVADKLSDPWTVIFGPDNNLWITEARGYRVSRINPANGKKQILLDLNNERNFPRYDRINKASGGKPWPQGGLMGMTLHPQFLTGKPFVYLAYIYRFKGADADGDGCAVNSGGCYFITRLVKYRYNTSKQKLTNPEILCDSIPGSNDHNGGRLLIAQTGSQNYLYYSVGDLGAGQFNNGGRPNHAQDTRYYEGKLLRFNLEADADTGQYDRWIPNDNPFNSSRQNAVWSYGHRNAQGLAYAVVNGKGYIYSSEHGPYSDDEINIIEKGKNYGHPLVIGYADGNYDGLAASVSENQLLPGQWHTTYPLIVNEKENAAMIGLALYRNPIKTLYPNSHTFLTGLFNNIKQNSRKGAEWPSEAPSSIAVYTADAIPGWKNSLLLPTLKGSKLVRLKLNNTGTQVTGDTINYFKGDVRYRDAAISPDGKSIYLAVDSNAISSGPSAQDPHKVSYRGCIIEFRYIGQDKQHSKQPAPSTITDKAIKRKQE